MSTVTMIVEGRSELEFCNTILKPYFHPKEIFLKPINLMGGVNVQKIIGSAKNSHQSDIITTLVDYSGFEGFKSQTIEQIQNHLLQEIPNPLKSKFIPYLQLYEFEALLFSNITILCEKIGQADKIPELETIMKQFHHNPETINGGQNTFPSKRLKQVFGNYDKTQGKPILQAIGLPTLRRQCKRFDDWIMKIENLSCKI